MLKHLILLLAITLATSVSAADLYDAGAAAETRRDYASAFQFWRPLAEQGNAKAQCSLGLLFANGNGVQRDFAAAVKWFRLAADQGLPRAQLLLGAAYKSGHGVTQDFVLSYMWLGLANSATGADESVREGSRELLESLRPLMTQQQISRAQELAAARRGGSSANSSPDSGQERSRAQAEALDVVSTGTGFFVSSDGYLLTNRHVIDGCASLRLQQPGGAPPRRAVVAARDGSNDLALIRAESASPSFAHVSSRKRPRLGQAVVLYGFPLAGVLSSSGNLTTGSVSALSGIRDDVRLFQLTAPVQPGNSGGAVLDAWGSVIGVVVSKLNAMAVQNATKDLPQNVNFAIKGTIAAAFLDSNGVEYMTDDSAGPQLDVEEIAARASRFTVRIECLR